MAQKEIIQLYDFQQAAVDSVFDYLEKGGPNGTAGGNPLVGAPTGSGKSLIIAEVIRRAYQTYPGTRIIKLTHVKELISQNYKTLLKIWPTALAGIYSAGLKQKQTCFPITYAGIQSIYKHAGTFGRVDIVIIDEAHLLSPKADTMYQQFLKDLRKLNPNLRVIGFTATHFRMGQGLLTEGNDALFNALCFDLTKLNSFNWLLQEGYLCPLIPKHTRTELPINDVHIQAGDYIQSELEEAVDKVAITEAIIKETLEHSQGRKHWLVFCSGINHVLHVTDALNKAGIKSTCVHSRMPSTERDKNIEDYKAGKYRAMVNNGILCLDEETEILTDRGWTNYEEMTYGHRVASWAFDGSIIFEPPKNIVRRPLGQDEKIVRIDGRGKDVRVTSNHRMIIGNNSGNSWRIKAAEEIIGQRVILPCSGKAEPFPINVTPPKYTTIWKPLEPKELTLDHCRFIGFWLGDGHLSKRCQFGQSLAYPKIIEWFDNLLTRIGFGFSRHLMPPRPLNGVENGHVRWSINRGTGGLGQARDSGYYLVEPYLNKSGSELYWGLSGFQYEALLEGFWYADGNHGDGLVNKDKRPEICGTQKGLYDLLQAIGVCRGFKVRLHPHGVKQLKARGYKPQWRMSWSRADRFTLATDRAYYGDRQDNELVWCVTSVTGNIVTRRKGKVTILGNTTGFDFPGIDLILMLRPTRSPGLWCLDSKTEILTKDGFKTKGQIRIGDLVAGVDPVSQQFSYVPVINIIERDLLPEEQFVSYISPSSDIRITDKHRMLIKDRYTDDITWIKAIDLVNLHDSFKLPVAAHNKNPDLELTDNELRFLGLFMTDGTLDSSNKQITIYQSSRYPENITYIDNVLKECFGGSRHYSKICNQAYGFNSNFMHRFQIPYGSPRGIRKNWKGWNKLEKYIDKNFSPALMDISERQFKILLEAIHTGDGSKQPKNVAWVQRSYHISTGNKCYADRLQHVALLNGWATSLKQNTNSNGNVLFIIRLKNIDKRSVANWDPSRKFALEVLSPRAEKVWCVENELGTIIIRRNGKTAIVGNCQMLGRGTRPVIPPGFDRRTTQGRLEGQAAGPKLNCLVMDFSGNTARLGPINDPVLPGRKNGSGGGSAPIKICPHCGFYNHASVRFCVVCRMEFPIHVKLTPSASTEELIKYTEQRIIDFVVNKVTYDKHIKRDDLPPSLQVTYYSGLRTFQEWVCLEHSGFVRKKAEDWWKYRSKAYRWGIDQISKLPPGALNTDIQQAILIPRTVEEAKSRHAELHWPTKIKVWINKRPYPEIVDYEFAT